MKVRWYFLSFAAALFASLSLTLAYAGDLNSEKSKLLALENAWNRARVAGASFWWMIAGALLGAVIPFMLIAILPTNNRLSPSLDRRSAEAERLLRRWGRLHAVRSVVSGLALLLFLYLAIFNKAG